MTAEQLARLEELTKKAEGGPESLSYEEIAEWEELVDMLTCWQEDVKGQRAEFARIHDALTVNETAMISVSDQLNTMWGTNFAPDKVADMAREIKAGRGVLVQCAPNDDGSTRFIMIAGDPDLSPQGRYDQWLHNAPEGLERLKWEQENGYRPA